MRRQPACGAASCFYVVTPRSGQVPAFGSAGDGRLPPANIAVWPLLRAQLFSSKAAPQARQWTVIRPFPRGTRIICPQLGHLK